MKLVLECLIGKERDVTIRVADPQDRSLFLCSFTLDQVHVTDEDEAPGGWSPESDNPMEQVGRVIGKAINIQQQDEYSQLSMLLHLGMHNLLDAAKRALEET